MGLFDFFKKGEDVNPYKEFDASNHFLPKIDLAEFFKAEGHELCWLVLSPINGIINPDDDVLATRRLSSGQKALHFFWYLDAQVTNGGFVQFYFNGYGKYVPAIIEGLKYIGDTQMAELVASAHKIYKKKKHLFDDQEELFGSDLYDQLDELGELDSLYYDHNGDTMNRLAKYIMAHTEEFCVDGEGNKIDPRYTGQLTLKHENGNISAVFNLEHGKLQGEYKHYYENGNLKEFFNYSKGQQVGVQEVYNKEGKLRVRETINPTLNQKVKEKFALNGTRISEDYYDMDDARKGYSREWFDNGVLMDESFFIDQYNRDGKLLRFFSNGQQYVDSEYINGEWFIYGVWDEDGTQTLKDGTGLYKSNYEDTLYLRDYVDHKMHGLNKSITKGVLVSEAQYEKGKEHGLRIEYYPNGRVKKKAQYEHGRKLKEEEFRMHDNPKVALEITFEQSPYLAQMGIKEPEKYPEPLNAKEVAAIYEFPVELFEGYPDDYRMSYNYSITVANNGDNLLADARSMDNARVIDKVNELAARLRFLPAIDNGEPIEVSFSCQFRFTLVEG